MLSDVTNTVLNYYLKTKLFVNKKLFCISYAILFIVTVTIHLMAVSHVKEGGDNQKTIYYLLIFN